MSATSLAPTAPAQQTPGTARRRRARSTGRSFLRSIPLVPAIILMGVFLIGPVITSFYGSFTNSSLTGAAAQGSEFVGLQNYIDLFQDPDFPKSVLLTVVFLVASAIIGQNVLGLLLAVLMRNSHRWISAVVGTLVVISWTLPEIVAAFASYAFFSADGTFNAILGFFGIDGPNWLYNQPMMAVILANIWRGTAFSMLVYSAALDDVPDDVQESAQIDGASGWRRFTSITLPMIRRSISTNLMLTTLQTLSTFTLIFVMTGGGPGTDSSTLPILAYQEAFKFSHLGFGTAIATILLIVGALFSIVYVKLLKPEVD